MWYLKGKDEGIIPPDTRFACVNQHLTLGFVKRSQKSFKVSFSAPGWSGFDQETKILPKQYRKGQINSIGLRN